MRLSKIFSKTLKESPKEAELASHKLLMRAGYIRQYASGIWGYLPLAMRVLHNIEGVVRKHMNRIDSQEIRMPALMTKELWDQSGRYDAIDQSMFRLTDRHDQAMLLGMTHEEPVVFLAKKEISSYKDLPQSVYQIQTKFRDEPRPRGGLIRTREFVMKDAYSFHSDEDCLGQTYQAMKKAYDAIYRECGLTSFTCVESDNGMFGGRYSHEFMQLSEGGEDTLVTCSQCDYKANQEIARMKEPENGTSEVCKDALELVTTPEITTIEGLCQFLSCKPEETIKAVFYADPTGHVVAGFVRGDHDVVYEKLRGAVGCELEVATKQEVLDACFIPGSSGPGGVDPQKVTIVMDLQVKALEGVVTGANQVDKHFKNFSMKRDFWDKLSDSQKDLVKVCDLAKAQEGSSCPQCGQELKLCRGIEIGNIFNLGDKYSKALGMSYLDADGKAQIPTMGCYGFGVSRTFAAIVEEHHDDRGIKFPLSVAPYHVHITALNFVKNEDVKKHSEKLYSALREKGVEVLLDDRKASNGVKFSDADLIGVPLQVVISPKSVAEGLCEIRNRFAGSDAVKVSFEDALAQLSKEVQDAHHG